jgi:GxxExxY protein
LNAIGVPYERAFDMAIYYMNEKIGSRRVDFLVEQKINVELKAQVKLEDGHLAQAMNYLEVYNLEIGLLINFGSKRLAFNRFTNKKYKPPSE